MINKTVEGARAVYCCYVMFECLLVISIPVDESCSSRAKLRVLGRSENTIESSSLSSSSGTNRGIPAYVAEQWKICSPAGCPGKDDGSASHAADVQ
jgi:hypothetical protein